MYKVRSFGRSIQCFTLWGVLTILLASAACDTEIQHGLKENQANEILAVLKKAGISAQKKKEKGRQPTFTVVVPKDKAADAFAVLSARNLPRKERKGVYELFGKSSLVPTSTEEHMKKVYATQAELAKTLERMEGVVDARVHLVLPQKDFFRDKDKILEKAQASVFLKILPDSATAGIPQIQALVAGAVAGLDAESVSVLIQPGTKITLKNEKSVYEAPSWLKIVAVSASGAVLLLGILMAVVGLKLKRLKKENQALSRENTGSVSIEQA